MPFALAYLFEDEGAATLSAAPGIVAGARRAPERLPVTNDVWDLTRI